MKAKAKKAIGRPPRTDHPVRLTIVLPGELKRWLRVHVAENETTMGEVIAELLTPYRQRMERRGKP